jgi:hypothetical protein
MHRRLLACGFGFVVLLLSATVQAETEYWVAIGSYQRLLNAEDARDRASRALPESFSIAQADTDRGFFYRVLAGPYLTKEIADHMLGEARRNGFETAWILATDSVITPMSGSFSGDYRSDLPDLDTDLPDLDSDLPDLDISDPVDLPTLQLEDRPERASERKLIDEAPEDYNLHRLNRDQTAIDWSSPFLLATTSNSVIETALAAQAARPRSTTSTPEVIAIDISEQEPLVLRKQDHQAAAIRIDGHLDEEAWKNAMSVRQFRVTEPDTLAMPEFETVVLMIYTERGVYVAFDMEQPADTLVQRLSSRDNREVNRDYVSFTLDTSGEARYAYWMTLALGDTQIDGTTLPERQYSTNWDGAWWGATTTTERGWAAEVFVPWSQMTMPRQDADGTRRIGFYGSRMVAHLNERWAWPPLPRSQPKFMSAFQIIQMNDVDPRQQWSFFPYVSSTSDAISDDTTFKAGADVFWRPTTNAQLTATLNPDFGTVEADEVIVNLTALETFFPEKRLFFLEGREIFETSPRSQTYDPIILLNTRRIGGSPRVSADDADEEVVPEEDGLPTELYGAAKATGQIRGLRYGVLGAFEQDTTLATESGGEIETYGRDFAVARALYEHNAGGVYRGIGGMATFTTHPDENATTAGIDAHLLSRGGVWKLDGQLLYSDLDLGGKGGGAFLDAVYTPRQGMKYTLEATYLDRKLDLNDAGFLSRNDKVGGRIGSEWVKSGLKPIRDFKITTFLRYEENLDGYAIRSGLGGEGEFTLNNLHGVQVGLKWFPARYDDRNSFGNGTFRLEDRPSLEFGYNTDRSRPLSAYFETEWRGDGVDGQLLESKVGVNWRPLSRLNFEVATGYQIREGWLLHQEGRNMTAFDAEEWQPEMAMDFFLSARQELRMRLQWVGIKAFEDRFYVIPETPGDLIEVEKPGEEPDDFNISALNFQIRYRWQIAPLSDVFLVYTRNGQGNSVPASFSKLFSNAWNDPIGDQLVFKLRYRLGT